VWFSNILYFHLYLGEDSHFDSYFSKGLHHQLDLNDLLEPYIFFFIAKQKIVQDQLVVLMALAKGTSRLRLGKKQSLHFQTASCLNLAKVGHPLIPNVTSDVWKEACFMVTFES